MPELPTGTVTLLFSDIEGSTSLLRELGDDYAAALEAHRDVFRAAFSTNSGVEVDTQGDAFFAAFARASDAVAAAEEIQRELGPGPVRVRIGLHTGEPQIAGEGYVGLDVHRGARVCAAGHGGQVLLTQPTRELVDVQASDLGEHRLKDLLEPQRLFQLGREEFPPLKTLDWTNLPVQATPLVGRERELAEAGALLREQRFLTVVGPPGSGKTRLALQLAADAADDFEHVWWVGLQEVHDSDLVEPTIAHVVGARTDLAGFLRDRRALLLLDNVEQVLGCAPRLAELVSASSNLKLLATSREPLRLTLEQQYPVPPLPDDDAVALFHERARAVRPDFAANGAVAEICRRLDGLPLAVELAAARVKILQPDALLTRLEQRLPLLAGGARDAPERQQTLQAAIAWSYDLLEKDEREALARLSVFAGGWTLEAAEAVCECDLEPLASLVDKSLVRERHGRFSMLETIREFARDRLTEQATDGLWLRLHAEYFFEQALAHGRERGGDFPLEQFEWFGREHDNLRTALDYWHEQESSEQELQLIIACSDFWERGGYWTEGRHRFEAALARVGETPSDVRAGAERRFSFMAALQGDYGRAKELAESAISRYEDRGTDPGELRHAYVNLAISEDKLGNVARSREIYEAIRAEADERSLAMILGNLGNMDLDEHRYAAARSNIEAAAAINRRLGYRISLANNLIDLGFIAVAEARIDDAVPFLRETLGICRADRLGDLLPWAVEAVASAAAAGGAPEDAVRLLAATTKSRAELAMDAGFYPIAEETRERTLEQARAQLSEPAFAAAWAEGEAPLSSKPPSWPPGSKLRTVRFGMTVMPDPPFSRMLDLIQLAERNGFEYGWTYDSHILWQESYALLPLVADKTERIKLGHCVTNPGIRDPTITASWYATMQDLSGGRMVMGIGRGDSSRRVVGLQPVKVAEFERRLRMMKDLMNGRPVEWNEKELKLEWVRDELPEIPMHVAGYGPKALAVAGRVGDGVIIQLADPQIIQWIMGTARAAAKEEGRDPGALQCIVCAPSYISDDLEAARDQVRWFPAMVSNHVMDLVERYGFDSEIPAALTDYVKARKFYDYKDHSRVGAKHGEFVTDEICDRFCVLGTPDQAVEKLKELESIGVDQFDLYLMTEGQERELEVYGKEIIPRFAGVTA